MVRKDFILCKYMECQFAQHSSSSFSTLRRNLQEAVCSRDIFSLLQLYAVRLDLSQPLANPVQVHPMTNPNSNPINVVPNTDLIQRLASPV